MQLVIPWDSPTACSTKLSLSSHTVGATVGGGGALETTSRMEPHATRPIMVAMMLLVEDIVGLVNADAARRRGKKRCARG